MSENDEESQISNVITNEEYNRKRAAMNVTPVPKKKSHAIKMPLTSDKSLFDRITEVSVATASNTIKTTTAKVPKKVLIVEPVDTSINVAPQSPLDILKAITFSTKVTPSLALAPRPDPNMITQKSATLAQPALALRVIRESTTA